MAIIILIVVICIAVFLLIRHFTNRNLILSAFRGGNVIVFGRKGKGKDLLFQYVINQRKKEHYYSNLNYGGDFTYIEPRELELPKNSYENFINNDIKKVEKNTNLEKADIYFSDAGIIFPSQYDNKLHKTYPSFTITYALSRQLYANNIHCNTQSLDRVWKALREQADSYFLIRKKLIMPFYIKLTIVYYERYNTAKNEKLPFKKTLAMGKQAKALKKQFDAENGEIYQFNLRILKKSIKYNTRAYHDIIFTKTLEEYKKSK